MYFYAFRETGFYTQGRSVLPRQLAVPLKKLADKLGHFPYMEYASSYALVNYLCKDPHFQGNAGKYSFDNMELIRSFEDASGSERGFILVHVEMVSYTGKLVSATEDALRACNKRDVKAFEEAFERLLLVYRKINESMETMWSRSLPQDYLKYRSFIFGTGPKKMNAMFPQGVVYEGVSDEPQFYRGESGANDSIVPTGDNLLEITAHMPNNDLTKTLRDFRSYRPKNQREFLQQLEARATLAGVRAFAMSSSARSKALYVLLVDQIREFRNRHWMFTKSYIIQRTSYDIATGGSPILQYLPNNLSVVLKVLEESFDDFTTADATELGNAVDAKSANHRISNVELLQNVTAAGKRAGAQRRMLEREVAELLKEKEDRIQKLGGPRPLIKEATASRLPAATSSQRKTKQAKVSLQQRKRERGSGDSSSPAYRTRSAKLASDRMLPRTPILLLSPSSCLIALLLTSTMSQDAINSSANTAGDGQCHILQGIVYGDTLLQSLCGVQRWSRSKTTQG